VVRSGAGAAGGRGVAGSACGCGEVGDRLLAKQPEATARVCDLLAEARLSLTVTDPLQAEAEALRASRCGERPG
jgi:hypothetical protein